MDLKEKIHSNDLVIPLMGLPGIKMTKSTLKENLFDEHMQFKSLSMLVDSFEPDGIFAFMDLTVELDALGLKVRYPENDNPSVIEHPIKTIGDFENLRKNWNGLSGRMLMFIDLMKKMANYFPIINGAYVIGPFSMAGELMGVNNIALEVVLNPGLVKTILGFCTDIIKEYTLGLFEAGADTVAILEPTAVILSPAHYKEFSLKPVKKLTESIKQDIILHICGDTTHLIEDMNDSGAFALSLDSDVSLKEVKNHISDDIAIIGNLDPTNIFLQGSKYTVRKATNILKKEMKDRSNFIISSGCDLPLETPLENIEVFMETSRIKEIESDVNS